MVNDCNDNSVSIVVGNNAKPSFSSNNGSNNSTANAIHITSRDALSTSLQVFPPSSLDAVHITISSSDIPELFDPLALAGLVPTLRPNGTFTIAVVVQKNNNDGPSNNSKTASLQVFDTAFLLAGLTAQSERRDDDDTRILTATLKQTTSTGARIQIATPTQSSVTIVEDDDDDMIDEDRLLDTDLVAPPPQVDMEKRRTENKDDCGGRKACDNCTCGRAEMDSMIAQSQITTSSCGNCSKGDAFRCAGCPYLGKPAFKAGEEHLVLDLMDDL